MFVSENKMRQSIMAGNYLPPAKCILHGKKDGETEETLAVFPLCLDIRVLFGLAQHTKAL